MSKTYGFAVIGCGSIAEIAHFPALANTEQVELVSVCDVNEERAQQIAAKYSAKSWYTDYREMLSQRDDIDAVILATPNNYHRNQAVAVAQAGKHLLVEKPLAVTNTEAWDIVDAAKKAGIKLMVGCDRRFWTHNEWAKDLVEQDVIGNVLMGRATLHEHWYLYTNHVARTQFRLDASATGGAALNDTGAHAIDLLTWLMGSPVKRVVGIAKRAAMPESYTQNDDLAVLMGEHENGAESQISCNRFSPVVSQVTELYGTEGTIYTSTDATHPFQSTPMAVYTNRDYTLDTLPKVLKDYRWPQLFWVEDIVNETVQKRWVPINPPREPNNYTKMIWHFVDCVINDKTPRTSGEDGARAVEIMCAVWKSMETNAWVDLPLTDEVIPPFYGPPPIEN